MKKFSREEWGGMFRFIWEDKLIVFTLITFLLILPALAALLHSR